MALTHQHVGTYTTSRLWNGSAFASTQSVTIPSGASHLTVRVLGSVAENAVVTYNGLQLTYAATVTDNYSTRSSTLFIESPDPGTFNIVVLSNAVNLLLVVDVLFDSSGVGATNSTSIPGATSIVIATSADDIVLITHSSRDSDQNYDLPIDVQASNLLLPGDVSRLSALSRIATGASETFNWAYPATTYNIGMTAVVFESQSGAAIYTSNIDASFPSLAVSVSQDFTGPPSASAVIVLFPGLTANASQESTAPSYSSDVAFGMPGLSVSIGQESTVPSYESSVTATWPSLSISASQSQQLPDAGASVSILIPGLGVSISQTATAPVFNSTVSVSIGSLSVIAIIGEFEYFNTPRSRVDVQFESRRVDLVLESRRVDV